MQAHRQAGISWNCCLQLFFLVTFWSHHTTYFAHNVNSNWKTRTGHKVLSVNIFYYIYSYKGTLSLHFFMYFFLISLYKDKDIPDDETRE